jgi:hypothetical protein
VATNPVLPDGIFSTKNPKLGIFWKVLQWKMFKGYLCSLFNGQMVYFMNTWYIYVMVIMQVFFPFWYVAPRKIWQPCTNHDICTLTFHHPCPTLCRPFNTCCHVMFEGLFTRKKMSPNDKLLCGSILFVRSYLMACLCTRKMVSPNGMLLCDSILFVRSFLNACLHEKLCCRMTHCCATAFCLCGHF